MRDTPLLAVPQLIVMSSEDAGMEAARQAASAQGAGGKPSSVLNTHFPCREDTSGELAKVTFIHVLAYNNKIHVQLSVDI